MAAIDPLRHARVMDGGGFTFVGEVGTARLWIHRRGWHSLDLASSTLFLLFTIASSSAKVDFEFVEKVGTTRLNFQHAFPSAYGHKLLSGSRLERSKCNPNFQGSISSTLFDALLSPGVNPLEGSPKCSCGKRNSKGRSQLPPL